MISTNRCRILSFVITGMLVPVLLLCSRDLGNAPVGPSVDQQDTTKIIIKPGTVPDSISRNIRINITPKQVLASLSDTALVEVYVIDDNHNPLVDQPVQFSANNGSISRSDSTDQSGRATAVYRAVERNTDDTIFAYIPGRDTAWQIIGISGLKLSVIVGKANAKLSERVPVTVSILNGRQGPVSGTPIALTGTVDTVGMTNGSGVFTTYVTSATEHPVTITAEALGAADTAIVSFWVVIPTGLDTTKGIRSLRIFADKPQLRADNSDFTTITAILTNGSNNPAVGDIIRFTTDLGIIDSIAVVNSEGRATVTLKSTPVNGVCHITAEIANRTEINDATSVIITGVSLRLSTLTPELSVRDTALVDVLLTDGSGMPIGGDTVFFTIGSAEGTFVNNTDNIKVVLDPNGKASARVWSSVATDVTVRASSLNTGDELILAFSASNLDITASKGSLLTGGRDSALIVATYKNNAGQGIDSAWILFATNAGVITDDSVMTDTNGVATTYLRSASFSGTATVQAKSPGGPAVTYVTFIAAPPKHITLKVTPDNIGVNGGVATLLAMVTDTNNNMVSGVNVNFRILKGPGGGEYIVNPITVTTNGVATSQLKAGSIPSMYRAVEIVATVGDVADSTKLTISGEPYIISVSRPENDTVTVPEAGVMGPSVFQCNAGAVVQDVNGNPVADGTPVHFSAVISGMSVGLRTFVRWETTNGDIKPVMTYTPIDVPFEDINNNYQMDANVDLTLNDNNAVASRGDDGNGNGTVDYTTATDDFFWYFSGSEPYWPGSWNYVTITDPADSRYRAPDTTIDTSVAMHIATLISPDGKTITFDTTYRHVFDTTISYPPYDSIAVIYADLNGNGMWDKSPAEIDHNGNGMYNGPASGDFQWWRWEMRPYLKGRFDFSTNDFAVTIPASMTTTKNGVAEVTITYPRQFARRLIVSVNAESHGIRDRDGERFVLPIIR